MTPITCSCERCQAMCKRSVCIPTPDEARVLIKRGYADRLEAYKFNPFDDSNSVIAPRTVGHENEILPDTMQGACVFSMPDGRCELHDLGLKPMEGRLAHHTRDMKTVRLHVLGHWVGKRYDSVRASLLKAKA